MTLKKNNKKETKLNKKPTKTKPRKKIPQNTLLQTNKKTMEKSIKNKNTTLYEIHPSKQLIKSKILNLIVEIWFLNFKKM